MSGPLTWQYAMLLAALFLIAWAVAMLGTALPGSIGTVMAIVSIFFGLIACGWVAMAFLADWRGRRR